MALIRVFDVEATGLGPDAKVCEVGWCDLETETMTISEPRGQLCRVATMPPDTRAVHHIRASDTAGWPPYDRWIVFEEAVRAGAVALAAHNTELEERFIVGHLPLVCTYKAALRTWPDAPGNHGLFQLLYWLEDEGLARFDPALAYPAHRAVPDAYAGAVLLRALYEAGVTGRNLRDWTAEPRLLPRVPIGNWRGKRWDEPDRGFIEWIIGKRWSDMDPDIVWNAERELERRDEEWRRRRATTEGSLL